MRMLGMAAVLTCGKRLHEIALFVVVCFVHGLSTAGTDKAVWIPIGSEARFSSITN
jgi:hypothetical protein